MPEAGDGQQRDAERCRQAAGHIVSIVGMSLHNLDHSCLDSPGSLVHLNLAAVDCGDAYDSSMRVGGQ